MGRKPLPSRRRRSVRVEKIVGWESYPKGRGHTVSGDVRVFRKLHSPQLGSHRDILVYLPPSYTASQKRYPVLYMHDGQNIFDDATSYVGEWHVDEVMEELAKEGLEAIVVGIPNAGVRRLDEYSPFEDSEYGGGEGEAYLRFLIEAVKPLIDCDFRTLPRREHTFVMGSSMGGLISLYAFFRHPEVFGGAGVMSPSLWFGDRRVFDYAEAAPFVPGRLYMDVGYKESTLSHVSSRRYLADVRRMHRILLRKGYEEGNYLYLEDKQGMHNEADWARRLPGALRFLLG